MTDEHESADRVLDAVLDQIDTTPQRRAGWPAWRTPTMNRFVIIGLGTAAVVVLLFVGSQLFGSPTTNLGGPGVEPTPTPEASVAEPTSTPEGLLPEGPHVLSDEEAPVGEASVPITVTIPAPDWYGEPGDGILVKNGNSAAPDGAGMIVFSGELYVYADPCQWATTRPDAPATTVDELVAALAAQASRDASEPVDITVDGHVGKSITLHVPDDAVFSECDQGAFGSWGVPGPDVTPFRYHQDPGQIDKLWIVDVDGELVVIDIGFYEGTPQSVVDELEAIVDSITFE
jgi:hypothetical protein